MKITLMMLFKYSDYLFYSNSPFLFIDTIILKSYEICNNLIQVKNGPRSHLVSMFHVKVLYPFIEWKMIQSYSVFHCKKDEKPDKEN